MRQYDNNLQIFDTDFQVIQISAQQNTAKFFCEPECTLIYTDLSSSSFFALNCLFSGSKLILLTER